MTVSIKRWIAMFAMIAITLAGTQYQAMANDGLNSSRYGFESKEKQVDIVAAKANLSQNPFRGNSVKASIVGNSVRVQKDEVVALSYAKIVWGGLNLDRFEKNPPVTLANRYKGELVTPNFGGKDSITLFGSLTEFGGMISDELANSVKAGNALVAGLESVQRHEEPMIRLKATTAGFQKFRGNSKVKATHAKSTNASFSSFSSMARQQTFNHEVTIEQANRIPLLRQAGAGNMHVMVFSAIDLSEEEIARIRSSVNTFAAIGDSFKGISSIDISGRVGRAIQWVGETSVELGIVLDTMESGEKNLSPANEVTEDEQDFSCSLQGRLLMDSFAPNTDQQDSFESRPSKLSVPAMMIGSRKVTKSAISLSDSVNSAVQTAKVLVKSIMKVIRPMTGVEKALEIPQRLRKGMFHLENLNWCTWRI